MENFPSNSHRPVEPRPEAKDEKQEPRVERIVAGNVRRRKKPLGRRFMETFIGGDAKGVLGYVVSEILLPAARDTLADMVSQGVERMIFGEVRSTPRRGYRPGSPSHGSGYVAYNRFSGSSARRAEERSVSPRSRATHDFDEIILASRVEAEEVVDRLFELISKYGHASVADLYELVGMASEFTDQRWGWTDFRGAGVTRISNGYLLDLPRTEQLK